MEEFKKKFLEEAFEHINDLEESLLLLENTPDDKELIERVFRAMHSLKGGGAMFGFENVTEFTHNLENIYDSVRNEKMTLTSELFDLTLQSVDHLKNLVGEDSETEENLSIHRTLLDQIMTYSAEHPQKVVDREEKMQSHIKSFVLYFKPDEDLLNNGTNIGYLLEDINELGQTYALPNFLYLPVFSELHAEKVYIEWVIILETDKTVDDILEVFIFVEPECKLEVHELANRTVLDSDTFLSLVETYKETYEWDFPQMLSSLKKLFLADAQTNKKTQVSENKAVAKSNKNSVASIRVSSDKLDGIMNLVSELVTTQARLSLFAEQQNNPELSAIVENMQKLSRELRDSAFSIVLIPIENMLLRFQRLVRDLSSDLMKNVDFITRGGETELDKTIIENLVDPIMHIIRNSLDHGIESSEERIAIGKPENGTIKLEAYYSGPNVHIQIQDDGRGIDPDKILQKAIEKGLVQADVSLNEKEIFDLIFIPGFSTATTVTDISGRGVGMDVVKKKIAQVRGDVEVVSELGVGTSITIKLPLTLSIIDGLLVRVHDVFYVIPLSVIDKIHPVETSMVNNNFHELLPVNGSQVPYINLRSDFNYGKFIQDVCQMIMVNYGEASIGLLVDEVHGEYQAVIKPLGKHYKNQEAISGATILGDGTIALVLDVYKVVNKFMSLQNITV